MQLAGITAILSFPKASRDEVVADNAEEYWTLEELIDLRATILRDGRLYRRHGLAVAFLHWLGLLAALPEPDDEDGPASANPRSWVSGAAPLPAPRPLERLTPRRPHAPCSLHLRRRERQVA